MVDERLKPEGLTADVRSSFQPIRTMSHALSKQPQEFHVTLSFKQNIAVGSMTFNAFQPPIPYLLRYRYCLTWHHLFKNESFQLSAMAIPAPVRYNKLNYLTNQIHVTWQYRYPTDNKVTSWDILFPEKVEPDIWPYFFLKWYGIFNTYFLGKKFNWDWTVPKVAVQLFKKIE